MEDAKPRYFSGEANSDGTAEDPGKWIKHFEKMCRIHNWDTDEAKISHFMVYLKGEAEDWSENNKAWFEEEDHAWDDIKTLFINRFHLIDYLDKIEDKL